MILRGYDDTHSSWLDDCHRHLHRIVETSQIVAVARFESMAASRHYGVTDSPVLHHESNYLLAVVTEIVCVRGNNDRAIALTSVGQDNVAGAVVPRNTDACHYSIVQLVLLVTVNDELVLSL